MCRGLQRFSRTIAKFGDHRSAPSWVATLWGVPALPVCARIMYMTTLPVADARAQLSRLVDQAERTHERFEITRNGHRAAVLLGADDYDALRETIAVLADESLLAGHLAGVAEAQAGATLDATDLAAFLGKSEE